MRLEAEVVFNKHEKEDEVREWGRLATSHSKDNTELSIEYLEKIWQVGTQTDYFASVKQLERLPKYLQKVGRFSEARQRCFELLALLPDRAEKSWGWHRYGSIMVDWGLSLEKMELYDCLRMIYKREKNSAKEQYYIELRDAEKSAVDNLQSKISVIEERERKSHKSAKY
ncbi:hypothetical protein [Psychrobacter sp. AT9]|uniref:hypothetical protein n=1 Tax=Psychrobacter sp. AT9 TaxID=3242893 RepID=UPI0039A6E10F